MTPKIIGTTTNFLLSSAHIGVFSPASLEYLLSASNSKYPEVNTWIFLENCLFSNVLSLEMSIPSILLTPPSYSSNQQMHTVSVCQSFTSCHTVSGCHHHLAKIIQKVSELVTPKPSLSFQFSFPISAVRTNCKKKCTSDNVTFLF